MPTKKDFDYLKMSPEDLELEIGRSLEDQAFGIKPTSDSERRALGRKWFESNLQRLTGAICGNPLIQQYILNHQSKERNIIFGAVFDVLAQIQGLSIPNIGALSAMIVHFGLDCLCANYPKSNL